MRAGGAEAATPTATPPVGTGPASGIYRTLCPLASGGMGVVHLAMRREGSFERLFGLKRLRAELAGDAEVRAMFLDEARLAGLIRHPNVVAVVDVGEDALGPFSVLEYVEGVVVTDLVRAAAGEPLPLDLCLRVVRDAALGLHAAHELVDPEGRPLGLVHRDVSPGNILVGFDGIAKVTDFGIAKALGRSTETRAGILKGKLGYMAPEQLRFEEPDRRADLFALGVVLFELLTGARLYESHDDLEGARRILNEPPPDLSDYRDDADPELVRLTFELLAKNREVRPGTAKEVVRVLDAILAEARAVAPATDTAEFLASRFAREREARRERITSARELASHEVAADRTSRRRAPVVALAAVLVLTAGALAFALGRARERAPDGDVRAPGAAPGAAAPPVLGVPSVPPAPASSAAEGSRAAQESPDAGPARRPPARKGERSRARPGGKSGVPLWENY